MPEIHPTALVDRNAKLADDVAVGAYAVIGPKVTIGRHTRVGSHTVIEGRTSIGHNNRIGHHVCLGQYPQDLKYRGEDSTLEIGDHNDIRENVTMHIGTENGGGRTAIGSHNYLMVGAHVAHDCIIGDHTILSNNVMLAGHIIIHDHAILAGGAGVSHYVTIGRYAFIGGLAGIVHDCPPFMATDGHPARVRSVNAIGLAPRHVAGLFLAEAAVYATEFDACVDVTAFDVSGDDELSAFNAVRRLLTLGVPTSRITMSSDCNGSSPQYDAGGNLVGMGVGTNAALLRDWRRLVAEQVLMFEQALPLISGNVARVLGLEGRKGTRAPGFDGDVTLLDADHCPRRTMIHGRFFDARA